MPEVACTFVGPDLWPELANCSSQPANRSLGSFAQKVLELAVEQLDRIEIRRVLREVPHRRSRLANRLLNARDLVDWQVVQHDDVIAPQGRDQTLLNIGPEHLSGHGRSEERRVGKES